MAKICYNIQFVPAFGYSDQIGIAERKPQYFSGGTFNAPRYFGLRAKTRRFLFYAKFQDEMVTSRHGSGKGQPAKDAGYPPVGTGGSYIHLVGCWNKPRTRSR